MARRRDAGALAEAALKAIESGQISVEEILVGGASSSPRFRAWLAPRLQRLTHEHRSAPQVRHARQSREEVAAILAAARAAFPGFQIAWGSKTVRSHALPRDVLVFLVAEKKRDPVDGSQGKIPPTVELQTALGPREVETDVRQIATGTHHFGETSPGFQCGVQAGTNAGSLSCLTTVNDAVFAIISGHVALATGVAVTASAVAGTVPLGSSVAVRNDADVDAARAGPVPASSQGGLTSSPANVRDLDESDTRLALHISTPRGKLFAAIDAVSEPAVFIDPATGAGHSMNALIRLDQSVTQHGDSGAPAMDATGWLVGFVEGIADGRTYLIPARRAIDGVS